MSAATTVDRAMRGRKRRNVSDAICDGEGVKKVYKKRTESPSESTPEPPPQHNDEELESIQSTLPTCLRLVRRIGAGSFGSVYRVVLGDKNNLHCALKLMDRRDGDDLGIPMSIVREAALLRSLQPHEHIVKLLDVVSTTKAVGFVLELCSMDLHTYISNKQRMDESEQRGFTRQILEGVSFMHSQRVAHRDLKPSNILLSFGAAGPVLKIADFGMGRILCREGRAYTERCATLAYRAPEVGVVCFLFDNWFS